MDISNRARRTARLMASASATVLLIACSTLAATPALAQAAEPTTPEQTAAPAPTGASASDVTPSSTTPAPAQVGAGDAANGGEIVVTAQFRSQRLQDVPLAITAVNSALLEARNETNIAEVAKQTPSVVIIPGGGAFGPSISAFIRGVGQGDFNPAYEPGVGLYIDDVYYATLTGGLFDLLDLDRVEVLRGPQGTLAGRNSEGGSIKLYSKKPDAAESGYLEAGFGSRYAVSVRAGADFKLTDDLFGRVSGVFKRQDGFVDLDDYGCVNPTNPEGIAAHQSSGNCRIAKLGETDLKGIRLQLRYNPSDKFDVTFAGDFTYQNQTNSPEVLTNSADPNYICGKHCTYADFRTPQNQFQYTNLFKGGGGSMNAVYKFADNLALTSITAYRRYEAIFGTDDDFSPGVEAAAGPAGFLGPYTIDYAQPRREAGGYDRLNHHFVSQELRLSGDFLDKKVEYTIGGFYSSQKTTYYTLQDIQYIVPGAPFTFIGNDPVNANSKALFATAIARPGVEGLTITAGIRYTKEHKDYTFLRRNPDGSVITPASLAGAFGIGALDGLTSVYNGSRIDYRGSVDYRFSPAVLAYATYSTGFKGGGTSARPFTAQQALQGTFKPETLTNYEIGVKTDLFDRRLRLNVSAYIDDYRNIQLPLADCTAYGGGPCGVVANAGNARNKGVEVEVSATPLPGLNIDGSASYLHARFTKLSASLGGNYVASDPSTFSPAWQASAGIQYKAMLGDRGSLTPRLDFVYNDRQFTGRALGEAYYLPRYALLNGRLTWRNRDETLEISAEGRNLTNKYYYNAIFSAVYAFSGTAYQQIGRPREWMLSVKKKF